MQPRSLRVSNTELQPGRVSNCPGIGRHASGTQAPPGPPPGTTGVTGIGGVPGYSRGPPGMRRGLRDPGHTRGRICPTDLRNIRFLSGDKPTPIREMTGPGGTGRSLKVDHIGTGRPQSTSRGDGGRPGIYLGPVVPKQRGPDRTPNLLSPLIYFHSGSTFNDRPSRYRIFFLYVRAGPGGLPLASLPVPFAFASASWFCLCLCPRASCASCPCLSCLPWARFGRLGV